MELTGKNFIDGVSVECRGEVLFGLDAASGERLQPGYRGATAADVERACALSDQAFHSYRSITPDARAAFLERIATEIEDIGDQLIVRCMAESGLPRGRLEGERARTVAQLRLFAEVVRDGSYLDLRIDPAIPERRPARRPDIRMIKMALGPVAIFGASNFPLAFSVAGGDTASALAAGCPVVVKAHPAHPGTSELVGRAVQRAVAACDLPPGVFALLFDGGHEVGRALVADGRIAAVGFTGSRGGGQALMAISAARPAPIPVYAEMSSVNPVILFPGALQTRGEVIGREFAASLTLGAGQFCTGPGLVLSIDGPDLERFERGASEALSGIAASTMLTPSISDAYRAGTDALSSNASVLTLARGIAGGPYAGQAALFATSAEAFLEDDRLAAEVFGASSLLVRCRDWVQLHAVLERLEGQLTVALHVEPEDYPDARSILPILETKVGRILFNGFGTGVEVGHAMVHGGPYPATSDGRSTSVGSLAIDRFLRPICFQDAPAPLLPDALKDDSPLRMTRRVDGRLTPA